MVTLEGDVAFAELRSASMTLYAAGPGPSSAGLVPVSVFLMAMEKEPFTEFDGESKPKHEFRLPVEPLGPR